MSCVRTTCPYCGVGCGVLATPDGKGGAGIKGDPEHPANFGRLCSKGTALGDTLGLSDRLLYPMAGDRRVTWDAAISMVAERFTQSIKQHGPDSVGFYVSGQLLTEDYYVANKLMKGFIGSANIDTNSRLCMSSSVAGHRRAFGTDTVPGIYEDLEQADLIVLVGSNLAWCHPVLHQRIMAVREKRPVTIVTIDPRSTATAKQSDMHLRIDNDEDVPLFNGLLRYLVDHGQINSDYVNAHVSGMEDAIAAARTTPPPAGVTSEECQNFYRLWADTKRVVTIYSQGVNQSSTGTDKVNAIINCHLATGRIGLPGTGPFSVTGQPNAMGGREVGGLANMLAVHLDIDNQNHRAKVADFWKSKRVADRQGLKAVDMFDACARGQIKALWIMGTNPAVSMPRATAVSDALRACDFVVVSDVVTKTDTTACADLLLPALAWGEKDGTVTNSERRISRQRAFLSAPGEARADWQIISDVACKMGFSDAFTYTRPAEIFDEFARMTSLSAQEGLDLDLSGLVGTDYDRIDPVQWPVTAKEVGGRFYGGGGFHTPDGRARMVPVTALANPTLTEADYPLLLNTGRVRDQWHTMTRTGTSPRLGKHIAEPFVEINPVDAQALAIADADIVRVDSPFGHLLARADVSDDTPKGQVFVPIHWSSRWTAQGKPGPLVAADVDPVSGQPALKRTKVRIERFAADWFGFALSAREPEPRAAYWAKTRIGGGWKLELAGRKAPGDWETYAAELFGAPDAIPISVIDAKKNSRRLALIDQGRVVGVLFTSPEPVAISRAYLTDCFGPEAKAADLLAGIPGQGRPDPGPTVCSCFNIGVNTLLDAIVSQQLMTVEQIGESLGAGTNCGSCRPELNALLGNGRARAERPVGT